MTQSPSMPISMFDIEMAHRVFATTSTAELVNLIAGLSDPIEGTNYTYSPSLLADRINVAYLMQHNWLPRTWGIRIHVLKLLNFQSPYYNLSDKAYNSYKERILSGGSPFDLTEVWTDPE